MDNKIATLYPAAELFFKNLNHLWQSVMAKAIHIAYPTYRLCQCLQQHTCPGEQEKEIQSIFSQVQLPPLPPLHGRIQPGLSKTREEAPSPCVNDISLLYKKNRTSECNLCFHLKGPNKKSIDNFKSICSTKIECRNSSHEESNMLAHVTKPQSIKLVLFPYDQI